MFPTLFKYPGFFSGLLHTCFSIKEIKNLLYCGGILYNHTVATTDPHGRNMTWLCARRNKLIFLSCLPWSCTEKSIRFQYCCRAIIFSRALFGDALSLWNILASLGHFAQLLLSILKSQATNHWHSPPSLGTKPPHTTEAADKNASIDPQLLSSIRTGIVRSFLSCS